MPNIQHSGKFTRDEIIQQLIKSQLVDCASTKTQLDFLLIELGYKKAYAYELLKEAKDYLAEVYRDHAVNLLEHRVAELEEQREAAKRDFSIKPLEKKRLILEITRELNVVQGLKMKKLDITSKGEAITSISIEIIDPNNNE